MRARRLTTPAVACAALMLSACAANNIGADGIEAATKTQLQADAQTLTQAAAQRDYSGAQAALATLNADLAAARAAGKVTDPKLNQIRASAVKVLADLAALSAAPAGGTPSTKPSSEQPKPADGNGKGTEHNGGGD